MDFPRQKRGLAMKNSEELEELKYELVKACMLLDRLQVSLHPGTKDDRPNHIECRKRILKAMESLDKMQVLLGIKSKPELVKETRK